MNLPRLAITKRPVIISIMAVLMLWGISVFLTISRREDPQVTMRTALLVTKWPGAAAEKVEQLITRPLEIAIKEVSQVKKITSDSRVGLSAIRCELLDDVFDTDEVWSKVRAKIQRVILPRGALAADLNTDVGESAVMVLAMYQTPLPGGDSISKPYTMREMDDILQQLEDSLQEIPAVGQIEKFGVQQEVIYIEVDAREWGQLAINAQSLGKLLDARNTIAPGGTISSASVDYAVRPSGEFFSVDEIAAMAIDEKDGAPVHLSDINVNISRRYREPSETSTLFCSPQHRGPCVIMSLTMRQGRNVVELGRDVQTCIEDFRDTLLPPDIQIEIVSDTPTVVDRAIDDFLSNLWQAIAIVLLVALVMIGLRIAIIMAAAIPLCMIASIGCMSLFGVELEQCSIASLIIALGMLVDNAVVISDNVLQGISAGVPRKEASWRGAQQLLIPTLSSTLTTIAAFLPLLTIPGGSGEYIRSLPIVVSTTLLISLFVAMTVTPMMCSFLLRDKTPGEKHKEASQGYSGVYGRMIQWCLGHKTLVLSVALILFVASLLLGQSLGTAFFPKGLRDQFLIEIHLPAGASVTQTRKVVGEVEQTLLACNDKGNIPRLKNAVTYVGQGGPRFFLSIDRVPAKPYFAQMMVNTTSKWHTAEFVRDVRERVEQISGARIIVKTLDMGPPVKTPVALRIRGQSPQQLLQLAEQVETMLRKIPGTLRVHNSWGNMSYQLAVAIDEEAANLAGVDNLGIANALYGYFSGTKVTTFREGRHQIDVVMRVKPEQRENLDYLDYLYIEGKNGKLPLNAVATVTPAWQVSLIQRRNLIRTVEVRSYVEPGYLSNQIIASFMPTLKKMKLPPGYHLEIGGEYEKTRESQQHMARALGISMVLIILILIIQFNSYSKPFIILLTLPLALIGAILGLWVSGWSLGFMPILGIISLCGIVVNNAIVLLDFIHSAIARGVDLRTAIVRSGQLRMRPILLTTLTTIAGFIPLAYAGGPLWEGLAYAMIFGLFVSTALTLIVIPVIFTVFAENLGMQVAAEPVEGDEQNRLPMGYRW